MFLDLYNSRKIKLFLKASEYCDSSDSLKFLIDTVGPSQIALETDYPFPLGETTPGNIIDTLESITKKDKERLFHGTALEWLNLDKNQFI